MSHRHLFALLLPSIAVGCATSSAPSPQPNLSNSLVPAAPRWFTSAASQPSTRNEVKAIRDEVKEETKAAYIRGLQLQQEGRCEAAIEYFKQADAAIPGMHPKFRIAECLDTLGKFDDAKSHFDMVAARTDPAMYPKIAEYARLRAGELGCQAGDRSGCASLSNDKLLGVCDSGAYAACTVVGRRYEQGDGISKDEARGASLYTKACDGGQAEACFSLGVLLAEGRGTKQDTARAVTLYVKACDGGAGMGCFSAGDAYERGVGVAKDQVRAKALYASGCKLQDQSSCAKSTVAK